MKISQLLSRKAKWNKHFLALDKNGEQVGPRSRRAVSWCIYGAVLKCYPPKKQEQVYELLNKATKKLFSRQKFGAITFNDARGRLFRQIKKVIKAAGV